MSNFLKTVSIITLGLVTIVTTTSNPEMAIFPMVLFGVFAVAIIEGV